MHVACTEFLTAMHTGDRTSEAIDAGGVLPGYPGTIVRDGYKGYEHLTNALHAWCGAHGLRDLAGLYRFDPEGQVWARSMADLLIDANGTATAARSAGQASLSYAAENSTQQVVVNARCARDVGPEFLSPALIFGHRFTP